MAANQHSNIIVHSVNDSYFFQTPDELVQGQIKIPSHYCNLTQILKAATIETGRKKQLSNYLKPEAHQAYFLELSKDLGLPLLETYQDVSAIPMIITIKGGDVSYQGSWGHPLIAKHLAIWASPKFAVLACKLIDAVIHKDKEALQLSIDELKPQLKEQFDTLRASGKIARRGLTDSIKDYLLRHPNLNENYRTWIYSDVSDCLNVALFGMKAEPLCIKRGCPRNKLRDTHSAEDLKKIEYHENYAMRLIDKFDCEPLRAMKEAIAFYE
jgi:hypothetical protein